MREAFEASILENPDEVGNYAAYADWLIDHDDPRGEFIQVQLALEDEGLSAEARKKLKARERKLLDEHEREWLGDLAPFCLDGFENFGNETNCEYQYKRGFLSRLNIAVLGYHLAKTLIHSPEIRSLHALILERFAFEFEYEEAEDSVLNGLPDGEFFTLNMIAEFQFVEGLRVLQIGEAWSGEDDPDSDVYCQAMSLLARIPRLEELHLYVRGVPLVPLFSSTWPHLRILKLYHVGAPYQGESREHEYPTERLASNPSFRNLEQMYFHPHHEECRYDSHERGRYYSFLPLDKLLPILESQVLTKLTHLQWRLSDMGDDGCRAIVDSGILKRLKWLDLRHGCISDAGASILAACPDFTHLEYFDIGGNGLTSAGLERLRATGVHVQNAGGQLTQEQLDDYQYLREGEFE